MSDLLYQIALTQVPMVGDVTAKLLYAHFGSAHNIFTSNNKQLQDTLGVGTGIAKSIIAHRDACLKRAEEELRFIEKNNIKTCIYGSASYPKNLRECHDAPLLLYYKGNIDIDNKYTLAIVGTRKSTPYGEAMTEQIVEDLKEYNVNIISGLAYGIDVTAHRASLTHNIATIGVLAHGLNKLYPAAHAQVAKRMIENDGAVMTEFISGTNPDRENFPKRNRIVAGLSDAVLVVEAAASGGALITADIAHTYNKDVFAIPGRCNDELSIGCNNLIKYNKAALVNSAADIAKFMSWQKKADAPVHKQESMFEFVNDDEKLIYETIKNATNINIDELSIQAKMPISKLSVALLNMEFGRQIKALPGKRYMAL
ncbi:MAG: DNA-protecting protein DprA [Bacteroidia bacterium]|nr:DNA-protecting protein DprA [Bacteroidia bacterium]